LKPSKNNNSSTAESPTCVPHGFAEGAGWRLLHGDGIHLQPHQLPSAPTLIYMDPPFFTGKTFESRDETGGGFQDTWGNDRSEYLHYLRQRIEHARLLLAPNGSLLLHLDWRIVHYAKVLCDDIFGDSHFQNELIWSYNSGGGSKRRYGRKHDTILWYSKGTEGIFHPDAARVPYDALIAKKREHLFHPDGKVSGDVLHISRPPNHSPEWVGWPTQKPLALMRWLVRVHSNRGDLVLDLCCGSGTTVVAAVEEAREGAGIDLSPEALQLARARLEKHSTPPVDPGHWFTTP
jgi:DNA modification methylase